MIDGHRTAQTAIQTILRLTNLLMAGRRVAVLGREPELAACLRAMGAQTLLTDPAAALDGHRVLPEEEAVAVADMVIGAGERHLSLLRDGTILVLAGPPPGTGEAVGSVSAGGRSDGTGTRQADGIETRQADEAGTRQADGTGTPAAAAGIPPGLRGTRVRDGVTAYRLDPAREVFVLDMAC
ncbi:hypothetical protein ACFYSC_06605 [Streptosporangium sp. NPDC004379]|uniref:hypothetical protein n=1 Tax=Streptosporangium sp. NPDC004379 TaxID=3366189 RepID=UPI0036D0F6C0